MGKLMIYEECQAAMDLMSAALEQLVREGAVKSHISLAEYEEMLFGSQIVPRRVLDPNEEACE